MDPVLVDDLEEHFYDIDMDWLNSVPDPNALVGYHQEYLNELETNTDHRVMMIKKLIFWVSDYHCFNFLDQFTHFLF